MCVDACSIYLYVFVMYLHLYRICMLLQFDVFQCTRNLLGRFWGAYVYARILFQRVVCSMSFHISSYCFCRWCSVLLLLLAAAGGCSLALQLYVRLPRKWVLDSWHSWLHKHTNVRFTLGALTLGCSASRTLLDDTQLPMKHPHTALVSEVSFDLHDITSSF